MASLLSREQFRTRTLARHQSVCVVPSCSLATVDAHHILNRNLFHEPDEFGGYFMENGAGLCAKHHLDAEYTLISTKDLYEWCEIDAPAIPAHLDPKLTYDTWGNIVVSEWERIGGEMFHDEGCQKALSAAHLLWQFPTEL